jgi:Zn-dependent M28 family amino/carboxypeptidase
VVYTAHLDHMGVGEPVDGDSIYNGAVDNASGVAALLWVAEAFTRLPTPPARFIVFLATTAEELGLFGSGYFVRRGPIPRKQIVAALNIDGATLMVHPLRDVSVMGASSSTLGQAAQSAGRRAGLRVHPADLPLLGNDHFPFAKAGIPALWAIAGNEAGRADLDGAKLQREWMETRLHTPKDDMSRLLDFQAAADLAAFDFELGCLIANGQRIPSWNEETTVGRFLTKRRQEVDCWR